MYRLPTRAALLLTLGLFAWAPLPAAHAIDYENEGFQPFAAYAVASVDEIMNDLAWVASAAGYAEEWERVEGMAPIYLEGVNTETPMGALMDVEYGDLDNPRVLGFVPVDDLEPLLNLANQFTGERPEPNEDGIFTFEDAPDPFYARHENGFLFITNDLDLLDDLPADPVALLGDLPERYTSSWQVDLQKVPAELREEFFEEIRNESEFDLTRREGETDEEFATREEDTRQFMLRFADGLETLETVTSGFSIDTNVGSLYYDFAVTAVEGSSLAETWTEMTHVTSEHSGFLLPDAAFSMNFSGEFSEETVENALAMFEEFRQSAIEDFSEQVESDEDSEEANEEKREMAEEVAESFLDLLEETIEEGKLDGGMALMLETDGGTFVVGIRVADGDQLAEIGRQIQEGQEKFNVEEDIEWGSFEHAGITFSTMTVPMNAENAQDFLGEEVVIAIGCGEKSFYFAVGEDCEGVLAAVIDGSQNAGPVEVPPFHMQVALTPIMRFAASRAESPGLEELALALENLGGRDRIMLNASTFENGLNFRLEMEEGLVTLIGAAARQFQEGMQEGLQQRQGLPAGAF